jgi:hypothetical protein
MKNLEEKKSDKKEKQHPQANTIAKTQENKWIKISTSHTILGLWGHLFFGSRE